jgi:hypothetical protein
MTHRGCGWKMWVGLAIVLGLQLVIGFPVRAQVVGAALSGTITDPTAAVVSNATVTITNTATGVARTLSTNAAGFYSTPNLLPGDYKVTANAAGFSTVSATMTLAIGAQETLNLTLPLGSTNQTVEVTGEAPNIDLVESTLGGLNDETTVKELPLNGRSWTDLADLQPGVYAIHTQSSVITNIGDRYARGMGDQIVVSGGRARQNNYRLNGISINDPTNGGPGSILGGNVGVDAISEFSVLTANFSAEYGRSAGGIINAVTKSGTNGFHGDVYEFLRNSALDARNFFDGPTIPPFRRNQFGGSAGGPIRKGKTFIFGDYEGLRQYLSITQTSTVPSAAARAGNLSSGTVTVDPTVAGYLNEFYPLPNGANFGDTGFFTYAAAQVMTENYFTIRVDHHISDKDTLSGTYFYDFANVQTGDEFGTKALQDLTHRQFATVEESHIFRPNLFNDLRVGYNRVVDGVPGAAIGLKPSATDTSFGFIPGFDSGQIRVGGLATFTGGATAAPHNSHIWGAYQLYDDVEWTKGAHSIKFGGAIERDLADQVQAGGQQIYSFTNLSNFLTNKPKSAIIGVGQATPHTRQSIVGVYLMDDWRIRPNLTVNLGLRWEMSTVPTEVNNEIANIVNPTDPLPTVGNLPLSLCKVCPTYPAGAPLYRNYSPLHGDPRIGFAWDPFRSGKTSIRGGFGIYDQLLYLGSSVTNYGGFPYNNSQPGTTVTQLAPGSFPDASPFLAFGTNPDPTDISFQHIETNPKWAYVLQWNLSIQHAITPSLTATIGYVGSHGVHGGLENDDANVVLPLVTPLPGTSEYLWPCQAPGLPFVPEGNTPPAGLLPGCNGIGTGTRFNTNVGRMRVELFNDGSSHYDGLLVGVTKRLSHGFQAQGSFTYSRSTDVASDSQVSDSYQNGITSPIFNTFNFNHRLAYGPSDFDQTRVLTLSLVWDIPTPKSFTGFSEAALGGWELGGIFHASDGQPFTAQLAGDAVGDNSSDPIGYPDRLNGPGCQSLVNPGNVQNYIKLQCFTLPSVVSYQGTPYLRFGNEGRNAIWGPGLETFDLSLVKNTHVRRISESFNAQFRVEFFNLLNRANFFPPIDNEIIMDPSIPGFGISSPAATTSAIIPGAGAIDKTTTTSRQIQLALKLLW